MSSSPAVPAPAQAASHPDAGKPWWKFGHVWLVVAGPAAVVVAAVPLASILGARVYTGLSDLAFRRLVLGLLTAAGVALLGAAVPALLARPA